ncbi:putative LPS assembly protein LptD [Mucilaginibacter hurinus]|uniref:putative LPS assembly protein LptD n=1 Tax=Mucilaginibacter hurinus TaxID=2201324 RepID=UPI0011BDC284|nr:putative LPS assembly protein LptD [Mucilaginibacter hurinus]
MAVAYKGEFIAKKLPAKDTIIKLDPSKPIDRRLINGPLRKAENAGAATPATSTDTVPATPVGNDTSRLDTGRLGGKLPLSPDSDTTQKDPNGLESEVKAHAEDTIIIDNERNMMHLYGKARVSYEGTELDAEYIRVDRNKHLIFASGRISPKTRRYIGRPIIKQDKDKPAYADSILFDYKTKKAKVFNPASEQDGNFISGGQAKKLNETEVAYRNVIFSTCNEPFPDTHFGIVITKGIGEKKRIISGPAFLEIANVPLPLAIPFGFFPKPDARTSGVILPTFGEDQRLGFFIRNLGYYIALNDHIDFTNNASLYSKGSYELSTAARYLKRYKYQGNLTLSYSSHKYGLPGDPPQKTFNISWTHSQDPNANPGNTFSASVNAGSSSFYQNSPAGQGYSLQQLTQNNMRSSISYGKTWAGTPFNLTVGLGHSQEISAKRVTLDLPTIAFNMSTLSPFDKKDRVGEQKWYQKITVGYSMQAQNRLDNIPESQLFTKETLTRRMKNGMQHQIPIGLSLNILKYFQFNTSANYTERWYLQTIRKRYDRNDPNVSPGTPVTDTVTGFSRAGEYNLSAGFSTKVYSIASFKGKLRAIRHVMTPSISFNYKPDFADPSYGYYRDVVSEASIPFNYTSQRYSIYEQSVYGGPSAGRSAGIGFNLDNTIDAKIRPKSTDTSNTDKKISILQGLSLNTFYNFAADSLRLSPLTFSGHTGLFNQKVNISFNGSLNPYTIVGRDSISNGAITRYARQTNRFTWQDGRFPLLTSFNVSMSGSLNSTSFNPKRQQQPPPNTLQNMSPQQAQRLAQINSDPGAYIDFNVPWNISFSYNFTYNNQVTSTNTTNTLMISGDVSITPKWKIQYSTNYDLKAMQLSSATSFAIYRDLHCWDLSIQWLPFGYYKSYNVTIKVKSTILQDLKLTKRNDYSSNRYFGGGF